VRISETRSPDSRRDSTLPSSPGLLHRTTLGKGRAWVNDPVVRDRKGKGRAMDVEQFLDDGQEESDDPLELPLSPPRPSKRHRPSPATVPKGKLKDHSHEERIPSPEPPPWSTKKRKRRSSSFDSESSTRRADSDGNNLCLLLEEQFLNIIQTHEPRLICRAPRTKRARQSRADRRILFWAHFIQSRKMKRTPHPPMVVHPNYLGQYPRTTHHLSIPTLLTHLLPMSIQRYISKTPAHNTSFPKQCISYPLCSRCLGRPSPRLLRDIPHLPGWRGHLGAPPTLIPRHRITEIPIRMVSIQARLRPLYRHLLHLHRRPSRLPYAAPVTVGEDLWSRVVGLEVGA
jgi:hypothetical protein